jgi:hypothetical protein
MRLIYCAVHGGQLREDVLVGDLLSSLAAS